MSRNTKNIFREDDLNSNDMSEFEDVFDSKIVKKEPKSQEVEQNISDKPVVSTLVAENTQKVKKRRVFAVPFGFLMLVFSLIGIITTVSFCVDGVKSLINKDAEMVRYEELLEPVVMYDPTPFDDISNADPQFLIETAIWATVTDSYESQFEIDESSGKQIVPVADVEEQFVALFGTDVQPQHMSFIGNSFEIEYSDVLSAYLIPITGITPLYYPDVTRITTLGDSVTLDVAYISVGDIVDYEDGQYVPPEPTKYMRITLRSNGGNQYISAIQVADSQQ